MCMKPMHRLGGAYAGAGFAYVTHQPWWVMAASAAIAAATGPGPDVDQHRWWRRLDKWVPDEWLGWGGPLQHRGITHWWFLPALTGVLLYATGTDLWWAWAAIAGWASHLVLDFIWGMASPWDHRGPGIPLLPWSHHHGLGLDTGGWLETVFRWVLSLAPVVLIWHLATG